jgi:hypothetical protein
MLFPFVAPLASAGIVIEGMGCASNTRTGGIRSMIFGGIFDR